MIDRGVVRWMVDYKGTAGLAIAGTDITLVMDSQTQFFNGTATILYPVTTASVNNVIVVQLNGAATTVTPLVKYYDGSNTTGGSSMNYFRIA